VIWYLVQIVIVVGLTYLYAIKITPEQPIFDIVVFSYIVAYLFTFTISLIFDLLLRTLWLLRHGTRLGLNALIGQQRRENRRIEVAKKTLPRP
jgi:hypothetical protein